jgi:hypothetical protein
MSQLSFKNSELRLATGALATIAALAPALYFLKSFIKQEGTEHVKTFNKLLQSYSTLRPEALVANATREFKHTVLPVALELPSRTLAPFKEHAGMVFSLFYDFRMVPQEDGKRNDFYFSKATNTVIAHCKMGGKVNPNSEMGARLVESGIADWWTECILFVQMTEDGKRIIEVREFVDSAKAEELQKKLSGVLSD